jgi:uncharacterized membrane protein AbrB (regulator of aidB expression)
LAGNLLLLLWLALVIVGIGAMQWGASRVSDPLDAYAGRAGMRGTVAGALLGMATAAPEISVNIASVAFVQPQSVLRQSSRPCLSSRRRRWRYRPYPTCSSSCCLRR